MKFTKGKIDNKNIYTLTLGELMISIYWHNPSFMLLWNFKPCVKIKLWYVTFTYWNNDWIKNAIKKK